MIKWKVPSDRLFKFTYVLCLQHVEIYGLMIISMLPGIWCICLNESCLEAPQSQDQKRGKKKKEIYFKKLDEK